MMLFSNYRVNIFSIWHTVNDMTIDHTNKKNQTV